MKRSELITWMRKHYPKAFGIRKKLAKKRIQLITKNIISIEEVQKAEQSLDYKIESIEKYSKCWKKVFDETNKKIDELFESVQMYSEKKDLDKIRQDMLFCKIAYGFQPDEYMFYDLENKNYYERKAYVSDAERYIYTYTMGDISDIQTFLDKTNTYKRFAPYYKREAIVVTKSSKYDEFKEFVQRHPQFVCKKACASRGSGVELIDVNKCGKTEEELFKSIVSKGKHLLEEKIIQDNKMSFLNKSSVNTVRCITFKTRDRVEVAFTFLKVGRKGSFVDNGGAGGILVGIDKLTGILNSNGYDEYNVQYEKHPDNNVIFKGYQLPDWDEMREMCKEMAKVVPTVNYVGWDVAYSEKGWVIIEGNMGQFIGPQIVMQRGIKEDIENYKKNMNLYLNI